LTGLVAALPVSAGGGVVVVTTDNVNLRSLPGSAGDVLDVIPTGPSWKRKRSAQTVCGFT
jgi:hypothetical protein